jgi:hypothetical protein
MPIYRREGAVKWVENASVRWVPGGWLLFTLAREGRREEGKL